MHRAVGDPCDEIGSRFHIGAQARILRQRAGKLVSRRAGQPAVNKGRNGGGIAGIGIGCGSVAESFEERRCQPGAQPVRRLSGHRRLGRLVEQAFDLAFEIVGHGLFISVKAIFILRRTWSVFLTGNFIFFRAWLQCRSTSAASAA